MLVAMTKGIGPDGRGYIIGMSLDHYREVDPAWVAAVLESGGAVDDSAPPSVPAGQLVNQAPTVVSASAVMQRTNTMEA